MCQSSRRARRAWYPGSSKDEEPDLEPALKYAIKNAYKKGLAAKTDEERLLPDGTPRVFRFKVEEIYVEGYNPPTDYRAFLSDHHGGA